MTRHTITVTVVVESTSSSSKHTAEALLSHILDCQEYRLERVDHNDKPEFDLQLDVASAETWGIKIEAGWAVA